MNATRMLSEYFAPGSRNRRLLQYVLVGAIGLGINQGVLYLATGIVGLSYVIGGTLSRVVSVLANYGLNDLWTWGGRGETGLSEYILRGFKYVLTRIVGIGIGLGSLVVFVELFGLHYLVANVLAVGVGVVWGFTASERWVWRAEGAQMSRFERALVDAYRRVTRPLVRAADTDAVRRRVQEVRRRGRAISRRVRAVSRQGRTVSDRVARRFRVAFPAGTARRAEVDPGAMMAAAGNRLRRYASRIEGYEPRERLASLDRTTLAVLALAGVLFVAFTVYTSLLYRGYHLTGADFGSYLHMFWTTVNGQGVLQQGKFRAGHPGGVYWGGHFSLTLLSFLPFFAVWQSPYALVVAKSFVLAASVPLLWLLARHHIESRRLAGLVVVSYAFNPFLWSAWAFDFQEQSLLPLLVFGGYLLYVREHRGGFLVVFTLALLTNEFVIPVAVGFLLGLAVSSARRRTLSAPDRRTLLAGVGLAVASHVLAGFVISQFSTVSGIPVRVLAQPLQPLVDGPRVSLGSLVPVVLSHPEAAFAALANGIRQKIVYLVAFSLPFLFVAYADEVTLGSLAPFVGFAWILSNDGSYLMFRAHYPLYLLPFVYIGAVRAVGRWGHLLPSAPNPWRSAAGLSRETAAKLGVTLLLVNAGVFVVIGGGNMKAIQPKTDHHATIEAGLASIPQEASVVTQNDLYPRLATRPHSAFIVSTYEFDRYEREIGPITPEYIVYDTELRDFWVDKVLDSFGPRVGTEYELYRYEDGFWVFKRGYEGDATAVTSDATVTWVSDDTEFDAGWFTTASGVREDGVIVSRNGQADQRIWYGPYVVLAPGTYTATFTVRTTGTGDRPAATVDVTMGDSHRVVASRQVPSGPGFREVTVRFTTHRPQTKVEFRGTHAAPGGTVAFDGVSLVKQAPTDEDVPTAADGPDGEATAIDRPRPSGGDPGTDDTEGSP